MEQEAEYLAALESAVTYKVEGNSLELRDAKDAIAVQMTRSLEVAVPEPEPNVPTGRVTAPNGVNVRTGPGTNFPILGTAPFGTEGEIIGRSADDRWWVAAVPVGAGRHGLGLGRLCGRDRCRRRADHCLAGAAGHRPGADPDACADADPGPGRDGHPRAADVVQRLAHHHRPGPVLDAAWSVENVQAVWVYPQGQPYQNYPRTGQGSEQVCPPVTTTYEMRVLLRDGTVTFQRATVTVRPAAVQNPLNSTAWQVTGYYIGNAVVSPISGTTLTMRFDGSTISGNAGCNTYNATYSVSGSSISIGSISTGMSMCDTPTGIMEQERDFLAALRSSATFQFDASQLTLRRADGTVTVFSTRIQ